MSRPSPTLMHARQRGFGLAEIMVGVTIGLLALLIVYQVLGLAEGYRRTTTAGGDAQSTGMISSYILSSDIQGAGMTISESARELATCPSTGNFATTWRPIPVLIRAGATPNESDSFSVFAGSNSRLVSSLEIVNTAVPGATFDVQSPLGFQRASPTEPRHMFVISDIMNNNCEAVRIGVWPPPLDTVTGFSTITPNPPLTNTYPQGQSWVVNLGPENRVRKVNYDVVDGVLRVTDLITGAAPNPIASNIALMRVQYGVDTTGDNFIDTWVSAADAPWRHDDVLNPAANALAQWRSIKAIRIALVVRSSQFERQRDAEGREVATDINKGQADATSLTSDFKANLFPCTAPCDGNILVTLPGSANYRYRVFHQVIPLVNQIWNPS